MHTDSLIEILALLDLSTLHKISFKNKRLFDSYNCDRFWRMKLTNVDLLGLDYLIDPLYFNSTSKEIYEQHEKYQKRFAILSNELRCNGLNHCYGKIVCDGYGKIVCDASECFDHHILSTRLMDQRDDIKTLSLYNKQLTDAGVSYINYKTIMTIIADYVTSKIHNLIYLDISENYFWFSGKTNKEINNIHNLKRILDHPSIIFVNITNLLFEFEFLNERQVRKLIWIPEPFLWLRGNQKSLDKFDHIKWSERDYELSFSGGTYSDYIPNNIRHMKDEIILWHRRFYHVVNPYIPNDIYSGRIKYSEEDYFK
jgi:hypothetical protein